MSVIGFDTIRRREDDNGARCMLRALLAHGTK
jgi:hypothetical protein